VQVAAQPPALLLARADQPFPRGLQLLGEPGGVHGHGQRRGDEVEYALVGRRDPALAGA
jgi:hypothetical protein